MEKKPEPQFFERKSKLPSKKQLEKMKEKNIAGSRRLSPHKEDKPMSETAKAQKGSKGKSRKRLTAEQVAKMIKEWDDKSVSEWADEFDVSYQTVAKMAETVRKKDASLCPKKSAVKAKREDIATEAIALFKKEQGEG